MVPASEDGFRKLHRTRRRATAAIRHHPDLTALKLAVGAKRFLQRLRQSSSDWPAASFKQIARFPDQGNNILEQSQLSISMNVPSLLMFSQSMTR